MSKKLKKISKNMGSALREYNFSGGIRGKHHQDYHKNHTVKVHQTDGSVIVHYFTLEEGAIMLEPDVREYFPNSEAVNKALRGLIALIPEKQEASEAE